MCQIEVGQVTKPALQAPAACTKTLPTLPAAVGTSLQACVSHTRFKQRVGSDSPVSGRASGGGSAFTSYIAAADLQQAISKYRASGCSEAYYLLTAGAAGGGLCVGMWDVSRGRGMPAAAVSVTCSRTQATQLAAAGLCTPA